MTTLLDKKLIDAARQGDLAGVKRCIQQGATLDISTENGALIEAASAGHIDCMRALLDAGANINVRNEKGSTALMCAAFHGRPAAVQLLLAEGADKALTNSFANTAESYAAQRSQADILHLLRQSPDEVRFTHAISDRVMEEVYNFRLKERITLLRREEGGAVEAFNRESFADIPESSTLRRAFDEHKKRGGKLTESDVFDIALQKPRNSGLKPF